MYFILEAQPLFCSISLYITLMKGSIIILTGCNLTRTSLNGNINMKDSWVPAGRAFRRNALNNVQPAQTGVEYRELEHPQSWLKLWLVSGFCLLCYSVAEVRFYCPLTADIQSSCSQQTISSYSCTLWPRLISAVLEVAVVNQVS